MLGNCNVTLNKHYAAELNNSAMLINTGDSGDNFYKVNISDGRGKTGSVTGTSNIDNSANGSHLVAHVDTMYVSSGGSGVDDDPVTTSPTQLTITSLYLSGDNAIGIYLHDQTSTVIGQVGSIVNFNSPTSTTAIKLTSSLSSLRLSASSILADTVYDLGFDSRLYLICPNVSGARSYDPEYTTVTEISDYIFNPIHSSYKRSI